MHSLRLGLYKREMISRNERMEKNKVNPRISQEQDLLSFSGVYKDRRVVKSCVRA